MRTLELYFSDLTAEAKEKYLKVQGVSSADELNWEVNPIAIIEVEEETPEETLKGSFVSVWEQGTVQTEGTLNTKTGQVTAQSVESGDLGSLEREYFEDQDGNEYEVCTECHEYILKAVMDPDKVGKGLSETKVCANPDCDSRRE